MPFLIAIISAAGALYFFMMRARNAADAAHDVIDMANDVRLAARRFGFKRQGKLHAVEGVDDPDIICTAIACAFFELDGLPNAETHRALMVRMQSVFNINLADAEEMTIFSRWLATQCQSHTNAITRLSRRLFKLNGADSLDDLMTLISATLAATDAQPSSRQSDALGEISRALRV
jgi:hypothetical protein